MNGIGTGKKTIGILGAGQLGLMLSQSLADLGTEVRMFDPSADSCGARRTAFTTIANFENEDALTHFFEQCDRVTYEFEHIPTQVLQRVLDKTNAHHKLWPSLSVLRNAQNRIAEKEALAKARAPLTDWVAIHNLEQLHQQKNEWLKNSRAGILKTANGGYDGKGQWRVQTRAEWDDALRSISDAQKLFPFVLEEKCQLQLELSVIVGRHPTLGGITLPAVENKHVDGILDTTFFPPRLAFEICEEARRIAERIADVWDVFGLLTVEFFAVESNGSTKLIVNEVAPRPHNSGHITRRSLTRSQFDILAQILLDFPFQYQHVAPDETWAMWNTLGDLWESGAPWWPPQLIGHGSVCEAMLYGKPTVRKGRKMGHVIVRGANHAAVEKHIEFIRSTFHRKKGGLA